ncbi:hypothetical protein EDC04DRAFT_2901153 [Pisolithus marmoratus]|nr:hypothetical protein EDC04DRAFT_2901153 [Pisolithus marmoratus]
MSARALPPANALPLWIRQHPCSHEIESAYNICLNLEGLIQHEIDSGKEMEKEMIHCRIGDHNSQWSAQDLLTLGECYYDFFVRLLKAAEGSTPTASSHPSPPSFDDRHRNDREPSLGMAFRCAVTKVYDSTTILASNELIMKVEHEGAEAGPTHCARIFPESINANIASGSEKYATSVWAVLVHFGYSSLREELDGPNIHRLENVITMEPSLHNKFNSLQVWFTATGRSNEYKLEASYDFFIRRYPNYVTFSTPDPKKLPLPSSTYLAIHAACAKVAHLSGAAEYIAEIFRRMEETLVLAEDGGSAELLHTAITSSMRIVST